MKLNGEFFLESSAVFDTAIFSASNGRALKQLNGYWSSVLVEGE